MNFMDEYRRREEDSFRRRRKFDDNSSLTMRIAAIAITLISVSAISVNTITRQRTQENHPVINRAAASLAGMTFVSTALASSGDFTFKASTESTNSFARKTVALSTCSCSATFFAASFKVALCDFAPPRGPFRDLYNRPMRSFRCTSFRLRRPNRRAGHSRDYQANTKLSYTTFFVE